ncbi:MAG: 4Fe-4S dicluster domain-containing protein [Bacteroidales bacterium]
MIMAKGAIVIDIERCKGCGVCIPACPNKVIALAKKVNNKGYNYLEVQNDNCIGCANCAVVCPDGCITVYRAK